MNLETKREKQKALLSNEENCLPFLNGDRFVLERQRQVSSGESNASRSEMAASGSSEFIDVN